jgi:hypothetical protein
MIVVLMEQVDTNLPKKYQQSLRLTFSYDKGDVKLINKQAVRMTAAPSYPLSKFEGQSGFWMLLKDKEGKHLYRRIIQNPIRTDEEVFSEDSSEGIIRTPVSHPKGEFQIVVPDIPEAEELEFVSSPLEIEKSALQAKTLKDFSLKINTK